ncbi:VapC toxin family PIN domain ribonuclease, partial [Rhizobium ruizarguesonis]
MSVLDTNGSAKLLTPAPNVAVIEGLGAQPPLSVFTIAITEAEILYGFHLLPHGRRRHDLEAAVLPIFNGDM